MERYKRGKIYKIVCRKTGKQYIGSTCKRLLSERLASHVADFKRWINGKRGVTTSFEILKENDYYIELIESVPCSSNDELKVRERFHIENKECVNKQVPLRTSKEYKEQHKEEICEQKKEYYKKNEEKYKEKYDCPCGSTLCKGDKARHEKTIKHQNYLRKELENAEKLLEKNVTIKNDSKNI